MTFPRLKDMAADILAFAIMSPVIIATAAVFVIILFPLGLSQWAIDRVCNFDVAKYRDKKGGRE